MAVHYEWCRKLLHNASHNSRTRGAYVRGIPRFENRETWGTRQSPPIDTFFQKDFLRNNLLGNREYLFDQVPALMAIFDNVTTVDQLTETLQKMSLVKQGLLGKPMAPMLILAGVKDTQVPISDIYLLLDKGDVPKTAWINPQGGHLGRQVKVWPDPLIFKQVIIPWLVRTLKPEALTW